MKITRHILENVKSKTRDKNEEKQESRYKKVFNGSFSLVIKLSLAV